MKSGSVRNPWRFGWLLIGIPLIFVYVQLFREFIAYCNYWFGGWIYLVPKVPLNLEEISWFLFSLSQFFATTSAFLLGLFGCAFTILKFLERKPSLVLAKLLGLLLCIYAVSVFTVVAFEIIYPIFSFLRLFFLWVPAFFILYLFPFWVFYSESKIPNRYSPFLISLAHVGLAVIPLGLLIFFAFSTYWNLVDVIQ